MPNRRTFSSVVEQPGNLCAEGHRLDLLELNFFTSSSCSGISPGAGSPGERTVPFDGCVYFSSNLVHNVTLSMSIPF